MGGSLWIILTVSGERFCKAFLENCVYVILLKQDIAEGIMKFVIEHLSKNFEKKEVLRDIDFSFEEGKIYGLLGRNGAAAARKARGAYRRRAVLRALCHLGVLFLSRMKPTELSAIRSG